ncbi:MAG: sulfotransferase family protein [Bacteroidia bacterium]|nr:sulfotransferase family protein [Bacteroidia bacterium]NNK28234.1 sulfotransferase family protein [Flavobacteriaceae bacterium]RZV67857.1 MAG: sulfotransferase family protein [Flavobacteriaceae bacterium]
MALKVIGAGFGRTGTRSLQIALEQIGFGKCYHMVALFKNPQDVKHWQDAYDGKKVDWESLFEGYSSAVDFPPSLYYKELASFYPDAKVILTVRDPKKWYKSAFSTIFSFNPGTMFKLKLLFKLPFSSNARNMIKIIKLNEKSIWQRLFEGKFEDEEYAINRFNTHIEEVKELIPEDKLLIFRPQDGYKPLCEFLDVAVPSEPFPNTNMRQDFHEWVKSILKDVI